MQRIGRLIEPFRVKPGAKVNLSKDFDVFLVLQRLFDGLEKGIDDARAVFL